MKIMKGLHKLIYFEEKKSGGTNQLAVQLMSKLSIHFTRRNQFLWERVGGLMVETNAKKDNSK